MPGPEKRKGFSRRIALTAAAVGTAGLTLISAASASVVPNWSDIVGIIQNLSYTVMPQLGNLIMAVVPVIIVLALVGFIVGFFDKILELINRTIR